MYKKGKRKYWSVFLHVNVNTSHWIIIELFVNNLTVNVDPSCGRQFPLVHDKYL